MSSSRHRSRLLSLVLRHQPERAGLTLDAEGWVAVDDLLAGLASIGSALTRAELEGLVATSDKQRFALSPDGARIRAAQGHSVAVDLGYAPAVPPELLFHGTVAAALPSIQTGGLERRARHAVHLSADETTAIRVDGRRGKPVVLRVRAGDLHRAGHVLRVSSNGVWLADHVPPAFIDVPCLASSSSSPPLPSPSPTSSPTSSPTPPPPRRGAGAVRAAIAADTVAACVRGGYHGPAGPVDLRVAIADAVAGTVLYDLTGAAAVAPARGVHATAIEVTGESTVAALRRHAGAPGLACLNFASARNPGGGYQGGAQAQEESLARASALVPCLETRLADHYAPNRAARSLLYLDLAIWSPAVPFFRDDDGAWLPAPVLASVITCAAPNAGALASRGDPDLARVPEVLARRADLVLRVAAHHGVQTLVLGAWGAGVFRNDPEIVAEIFAGLLAGPFAGVFAAVTFAVLDHHPGARTRGAFARRLGS